MDEFIKANMEKAEEKAKRKAAAQKAREEKKANIQTSKKSATLMQTNTSKLSQTQRNDSIRNELLTFSQSTRKVRICGVPLTRVRTDFQLRSTFFSVLYDSAAHRITLSGHGFGHGVGLSQEGTIRMVGLGISYDSIIRHYYTGASIAYDETHPHTYVENYINKIAQIIEEDKNAATRSTKKDDWLGRLFRLRDREEREEIYTPDDDQLEQDWLYDW